VLRPEAFADRKNGLVTSMRQVQALWRGEAIEFPGPDGKPHAIRTLPRPVQKELPSWVTIAGNPETYRIAGASGSYVLTHLLGQSLEELTGKLAIYRQAWRDAGHPGEGKVSLMLHTFVGDSDEQVRAIVREPMKGYLRSSLDLVKQAAWSFPAFKNRVDKPGELDALLNGGLTPADFDALLDFSFERYYRTSGLFGSPEQCVAIVDKLRAMQVDEIACLVDFGIPSDLVMHSLPKLLEVKRRCDAASAAARAGQRCADAGDRAGDDPAAAAAARGDALPVHAVDGGDAARRPGGAGGVPRPARDAGRRRGVVGRAGAAAARPRADGARRLRSDRDDGVVDDHAGRRRRAGADRPTARQPALLRARRPPAARARRQPR